MAILKVPYSSLTVHNYKPYLEVYYTYNNKISPKSFSLMDSGADGNVVGYQLGKTIGLPDIKEGEDYNLVNGVGGTLLYLERSCRIYVFVKESNKVYGYEESVWWIYPSPQVKEELTALTEQHAQLSRLKTEAIPQTSLEHYIDEQILLVRQRIQQINALLETAPLLGRPFFNNFSHVQFLQRNKSNESLCALHLDVVDSRATDIIELAK
jgi:hypothetical protein